MAEIEKKSPFVQVTLVDRDDAIAFLKKCGFAETDEVGTYTYASIRKTSQAGAGARYLMTVKLEELIGARNVWRRFVHRWSKKVA
jgi:hypothetical protein